MTTTGDGDSWKQRRSGCSQKDTVVNIQWLDNIKQQQKSFNHYIKDEKNGKIQLRK